GAVRAGVLESPGHASVVRISAEPVRVRLPVDGADRMGPQRSRFSPADGPSPREASAAVRRVAHHAFAPPSLRRFPEPPQGAEARRARGPVFWQLPTHDALF